jgi:diguanylate cyclase (GGDEF)-like protein
MSVWHSERVHFSVHAQTPYPSHKQIKAEPGKGVDVTLERKLLMVFVLVFAAFSVVAGITIWSGNELAKTERARTGHYAALEILDAILLGFDDAETGQRGYLLTGDNEYLKPYYTAISATETALHRFYESFGSQKQDVHARLAELKEKMFAELDLTIQMRQTKGLEPALEVVASDKGRGYMVEVRELVQHLKDAEKATLSTLGEGAAQNVTYYQYSVGLFVLFLMLAVMSLYSFMQSDATQRRKALERLTHDATHDGLTDLANRNLFISVLNYSIAAAQRCKGTLGVLFIDLDGFKVVNDTHGHDVGDEVLQKVAMRLTRECRESDVVARVGGDEFLILVPGISKQEHFAKFAEHLVQALSTPLYVGHMEMHIGASIGIAVYPQHGQSTAGLIKAADAAMYKAKRAGKGQYRFFSDEQRSGTTPS